MAFLLSHRLTAATFLTLLAASSCQADPTPAPTEAPAGEQWKTAYFKRGFVGGYASAWASGPNATIRNRVFIPFDGTKVRVYLNSGFEFETVLSKLSLARGKQDQPGTIEGTAVPIVFGGAASVTIPAKGNNVTSTAADAPIQSGVWYVQQSYSSEKLSHAYNVDGFWHEPGDHHNDPTLKHRVKGGMWPGNVYRIDVMTNDTRPTILCYGDSITHGYGSTPDGGKAYPEVLGRLMNRPTLNLGVNSDRITQAGGAPSTIKSCKGVDTVIILMGINDILGKSVKTTSEYSQAASTFIAALKADGKKVYIGTLTPSGGVAQYDKNPANETLRQGINTWIRTKSKATGVIDFDAAVKDPENPTKFKVEYQSDWIHPSDAGYQKMAETAAAVLQNTP